jgi:Helix-turn-helix domain
VSAPICGWAFNTGRAKGLLPSERLVLWALAEHVNGQRADLTCWPSIDLLQEDTGLTRPTVITALRSLVSHALVAVSKRGRGHEYTLLSVKKAHQLPVKNPHRPNGVTGKNESPVEVSPPVKKPDSTGKKSIPGSVKNPHSNLLKEPLKEPVAREEARSGAASGPEPGREDSSGGSGAPPPAPMPGPQKTPDTTTTPGGDTFNAYLDAPNPARAIPAEIGQEVIRADPLDLPVDPEYVHATVTELKHEWRMRAYPGRAATMSREDQSDAVLGKPQPKPHHLTGPYLAAMRKQAGIRHANA